MNPAQVVDTNLAQTDKDAADRLEVERLVAVEDEHEATELVAERLQFARVPYTPRLP